MAKRGPKQPTRGYRNLSVRNNDVAQELDLYMSGKTIAQIVEIMNKDRDGRSKLSSIHVSNDLSKALKKWRETYIENINVVLARELNRLEKLEEEYWKAWELSLTDNVSEELITINGEGFGKFGENTLNQTEKRTRKVIGRGNERFLEGIERVIGLRYKLLGIGTSKTITMNWRIEAQKLGYDPGQIIDALVNEIVDKSDQGNPLLESGEYDDENENNE